MPPESFELDSDLINKHDFFIAALKELTGKDLAGYLNGPITYPVPAPSLVRHYAQLLGIPTTPTGIVFLIEKMDDYAVAIALLADLYKALANSTAPEVAKKEKVQWRNA